MPPALEGACGLTMVEKMVQARTFCGPLSSAPGSWNQWPQGIAGKMGWRAELGSGIGSCERKDSGERAG